jgi:hypothetical protein
VRSYASRAYRIANQPGSAGAFLSELVSGDCLIKKADAERGAVFSLSVI